MMKRLILVCSVLVALTAPSVGYAAQFAGNDVFIPVVGRTPGAEGSQWRTDLVVANLSMRQIPRPVTITFNPADGSPQMEIYLELPPRGSRFLPDLLRETFGREQAFGTVRVTSSDPAAKLTARARIYNVGSVHGEFGQNVPGIRSTSLQRDHSLPGLSGLGANRSNIGISNPHDTALSFWISVFDARGELRTGFGMVEVAPRSVYQINDVFSWTGLQPFDGALVEIGTSAPAYVYASIVRGDSGDAVFIPGITPGPEAGGGVIDPTCVAPAPLHLAQTPADGWIVILQDEVDAAALASQFAQKYGFTIQTLYEHAFKGFTSLDVSPAAIAGLRCEPEVKLIQQNALVVP